MGKRIPLEQRFMAKINKTPECWEWTAFCEPKAGYGVIWHQERMCYAHRVSWELHHGGIPEGLIVRHKCDNPPCVNPAHLELGTAAQNMNDAVVRGRTARGASHPDARLGEADVVTMRARRAAGEMVKDIAADYGIDRGYASRLLRGMKWRHVV